LNSPGVKRPTEALLSGTDASGHVSRVLQLFLELLDRGGETCVLDVGPILGDNISFFSRKVLKFHVCDLFRRLNDCVRRKRPLQEAWQDLHYPAAHFNGILMWDLCDHLDSTQVSGWIRTAETWLKPQGMAVVISRNLSEPQDPFNAFCIQEDFRLALKPFARMRFPEYPRQNREIMALLPGFVSVRSFIYRNGIREYLFRFEGSGGASATAFPEKPGAEMLRRAFRKPSGRS